MRDTDHLAFQQVMRQLAAAFSKKLDETSIPLYFRALQRCEMVDVARAADAWVEREKFFPKAAEWLATIRGLSKGEPLLEMSRNEIAEWLDAERRFFQSDSCSCRDCSEARIAEQMDDKPLRFVPTEDRYGDYEKRLIGSREVLRGHWAHGFELARWYQARAVFYEVAMRLKLGDPLRGEGAKSMEAAA